jgi:SH3-like domain-containing protein
MRPRLVIPVKAGIHRAAALVLRHARALPGRLPSPSHRVAVGPSLSRCAGEGLCAAALLLALAAAPARAQPAHQPIGCASLRYGKVNLRVGPGRRYPIKWVLTRKGLPVKITRDFDLWRHIVLPKGTAGWVHERELSRNRTVVIRGAVGTLRAEASPSAPPVARAQPGVIATLLSCSGAWCEIATHGVSGAIERRRIWGLCPGD